MTFVKKNRKKIILIILFSMWLFLTLFYIFNYYNFSFSVISYTHSRENINNFSINKILKNQKISGEIVSPENNLGIITFNFTPSNQVSFTEEDVLVFRLKEKKRAEWEYENKFKGGLVNLSPNLPIGFPIITDSKGKTYVFEVESLRGNENNAISMKRWGAPIVTRYKFSKDELLSDKYGLIKFQVKKIYLALKNPDVIFFSFIYMLPFLIYFNSVTSRNKNKYLKKLTNKINKEKNSFLNQILPKKRFRVTNLITEFIKTKTQILILFLVIVNVFISKELNDLVLIILCGSWVYVMKENFIGYKASILAGLFFLIGALFFSLVTNNEISEKFTIWAFMFFATGSIQIFFDLMKPDKYSLSKK